MRYSWEMETVGIRELRQNASRYLAKVEAGEELGVTSKGRVVARLVPVSNSERSRVMSHSPLARWAVSS